jgi:hypothetical protein
MKPPIYEGPGLFGKTNDCVDTKQQPCHNSPNDKSRAEPRLSTPARRPRQPHKEWIEAVGRIGGAEAGNILFGFLEQREVGSSRTIAFHRYYLQLAATKIAEIARNDPDLGARVLRLVNEPGMLERGFVLLKTILALDSVDALLACLGMAHARQEHHLPYECLMPSKASSLRSGDLSLIALLTHWNPKRRRNSGAG